jgi:hypothetical protein
MRIQELLEGRDFDDTKFVKDTSDKREIDYDLPDDLIHFMHNDDDVYRRHFYPAIAKCVDRMKLKQPTNISIFKPAVEKSYQLYIRKYPIKELEDNLEKKMCERICNKIHTDVIKDIHDGVYKD